MHLKLLLIHFRNKHTLSPTYDIIVTLELFQYKLYHGYKSISFLGPEGLPRRLCKTYLDGAEFIN